LTSPSPAARPSRYRSTTQWATLDVSGYAPQTKSPRTANGQPRAKFLATKDAPLPLDDRFWRSKRQLTQTHSRGQQNVLHALDLIRHRPSICHGSTMQERHRQTNAHLTHLDFPPEVPKLICPTHTHETHPLQAHVRCTQPTNHNPTNTKPQPNEHSPTTTPKHAHTPPKCGPHQRDGGENRNTEHTARSQGKISTKRKETKNQKCPSSKMILFLPLPVKSNLV
jgi:hypothetical protein